MVCWLAGVQEGLATYAEEKLPEGKATMAGFGACRFEVSAVGVA